MRALRSDQGDDHADPWHLSFHGSQFPGDNPYACSRASLYRMMDFSRPIMKRWLEQVAESGKAIENSLVAKWYYAGYLVSPPSFIPDVIQQQYEDDDHWLTCTVDAVVCWPFTIDPIVCEVKSKEAAVIRAMQRLIRGPDQKHAWQIKTEIALAHEAGPVTKLRCINSSRFAIHVDFDVVDGQMVGGRQVCPLHGGDKCLVEVVLPPPNRGYLYYVSRDNPEDTFEFMFEYDPNWLRVGRRKLALWRKSFKDDTLPATNLDAKRFSHPFGWQWTKPEYPCRYCDFGAICREDHRAAVEQGSTIALTESAGVEDTQAVRVNYSPVRARNDVMAFWESRKGP